MSFVERESGVELTLGRETLSVDAWGPDTIRVQAAIDGAFDPVPDALARTRPSRAEVEIDGVRAVVRSGGLRAVVGADGHLAFHLGDAVQPLLRHPVGDPALGEQNPAGRTFRRVDDAYAVSATFEAHDDERFYGLGQHQLERLDLKGMVIDLRQRNGEICIPAVLSSRGYGFFWNDPSVGRVEFGTNRTRWVGSRSRQIDLFVYAGDGPEAILGRYYDLTGRPRALPEWTTGFWQSKTRYRSQAELLGVAREHWRRGLPLSVILVDFFHSAFMGDWDWTPDDWPDPAGMVRELAEHGCRVIVSIWPHVNARSRNFERLREAGWLVTWDDGELASFRFADLNDPLGADLYLLDTTNPEARAFWWSEVKRLNHDIGVRAFWVDACEPELTARPLTERDSTSRFHRGHGASVSNLFPMETARAFRDGLDAVGAEETVLMTRSTWAGGQRQGAIVWSGDTLSSWRAFQEQVRAGLNMAISGMPWWNADIGGFIGAEPDDEAFHELLVRWFQWAVFTPIVRLHGLRRRDWTEDAITESGGDNEIWSFGPRVESILTGLLHFRERLRPYVNGLVGEAAAGGPPPMRPFWFAYPDDPLAVATEDAYLFGPDLLAAPITRPAATERPVYLPSGSEWVEPHSGKRHRGGQLITLVAPLEAAPFLVRAGSGWPIAATWFETPGGDT